MINKILFLLFLLLIQNNYAQEIDLQVSGFKGKAYLSEVNGTQIIPIDSITFNQNDEAKYFYSMKKIAEGLYRISFDKNIWMNLIIDGGNISISTDLNNNLDSTKISKSESNKLYYTFLKLNNNYQSNIDRLNHLLSEFPPKEDSIKMIRSDLNKIQKVYYKFVNATSQKNTDSFIARYIKSSQLPDVDFNFNIEEQTEFLKKHGLDKIDFSDAELASSDLFTNITSEYLSYFKNSQLPHNMQEGNFISASDILLNKAKNNIRAAKQIIEFLINYFEKSGYEYDIEYVVKNYVVKDDICLDNENNEYIKNMINQMTYLHINSKVPDIIMKNNDGKEIELDKIKSDKILILFYASWCPHCKKLIPVLVKYLNKVHNNELKVLAVSLDDDKNDWLKFIKKDKMDWINVRSDKGWNCKAAKNYFIYATPTMFLIDKNKKIIGKPLDIKELNNLL